MQRGGAIFAGMIPCTVQAVPRLAALALRGALCAEQLACFLSTTANPSLD